MQNQAYIQQKFIHIFKAKKRKFATHQSPKPTKKKANNLKHERSLIIQPHPTPNSTEKRTHFMLIK